MATAFARVSELFRGTSVRQVRLVCGVILFAYVVSHFLNHALGNISVEAMQAGVYYHVLFWQFLPVAIVFYTAALVHAGLGVFALYQRRQFRWKTIEPLQLVLGLSIPALDSLPDHVRGMRPHPRLLSPRKRGPRTPGKASGGDCQPPSRAALRTVVMGPRSRFACPGRRRS